LTPAQQLCRGRLKICLEKKGVQRIVKKRGASNLIYLGHKLTIYKCEIKRGKIVGDTVRLTTTWGTGLRGVK